MRLTELLFSFKGRIQRLYWWVATIAVGAAAGAITGILEVAAKASGHSVVNPDTQQFEATGLFGIVVLLVGLVNLWINFALSVKRLHDRGRSGWWLVWQTLILAVAAVLVVVAIAVPKEQAPVWWVLASVVGVVALAVSIWLFVEIGCLRGTQGPNRFGEDPLGATSAGATMTATILQPEPGRPVERQSLRHILFGFRGRITRRPWWWGTIAIVVVATAAGLAILLRVGWENIEHIKTLDVNSPSVRAMLLVSAIVTWPALALGAKRLHDRNYSGWWVVVPTVVAVVVAVLQNTGRGGTLDESSLLVSLLGGVNSLFSLWLFVQCGLLKGTLGLNRFGPDPLGRQADASI
jgi:uncharacterized membrane protein YhaH (DUF805 family)